MATIVEYVRTGKRYCLLGTGFGAYKSAQPNAFLGNFLADVDAGEFAMVCICDHKGQIFWLPSAEVTVVSVDGQNVSELGIA